MGTIENITIIVLNIRNELGHTPFWKNINHFTIKTITNLLDTFPL